MLLLLPRSIFDPPSAIRSVSGATTLLVIGSEVERIDVSGAMVVAGAARRSRLVPLQGPLAARSTARSGPS